MRKPVLWSTTTLALVIGGHAAAQSTPDSTPSAEASAPSQLDSIIVTGTRQSNRTVADSVSPIQVLNADSLQHTGKEGLQESLTNVLPSYTIPAQAGGNLTSITRIATLRGLNPDHVLVLVNGKRFHPTSIVNVAGSVSVGSQGVDLNSIPTAAIQRIEVLTDGAAAQYGSDAIAGVINIILRSSSSGGSAEAQGGKYFDGDGLNQLYTLNQGFALGNDGSLNLSAQVIKQDLTNRAIDATLSPQYYAGDPRNNLPPHIVYKGYGIPESETQQAAYNLEKPIGDFATVYSFGTITKTTGKNWVGFRAANNVNNVVAIYPDGFEPRLVVKQHDYSTTAGVRGENLLGWSWDASVTYGKNRAETYLTDSVNPTYGLLSPTSFYDGAFDATETTGNIDLKRDFETGFFAAPLSVAVGVEVRRDSYGIEAGDRASYADGGQPVLTGPNAGKFVDLPGAQAFAGFRPADSLDASRTSTGGYVDFETKLLKNWDIGLAGRQEHYSDFGNSSSGKLSTRFDFTPTIAVRGSVGNGFRAPSLGQQYYSAGATAQYKGVDYTIANLPVDSAAARLVGSEPLKPEKSTNFSAGLVLKPLPRMTITVDGYSIKLRDRIVQSAQIGLSPSGVLDPTLSALLKANGITGVDAARYFLNGVDTTTTGVDIVGVYRTPLNGGWGTIDWTLASNFNNTRIDSLSAEAQKTLYGTQVFNQVSQDQLTMTTPKNKTLLAADWSIGPWHVFGRETRYGSFTNPSTVANGYSSEGPKWITDVEVGYTIARGLVIAVGAQNVFNVYPSKTNPNNFVASTFNGAQIYNAATPFGLSGGNYYARLSYSWL
jgi:iron complex outermembrane receptor protein